MGKAMAPLQVNKLASTEDSASAKSLTKKWPSRITSLLNIAVEKDKKLLLEGTNSRKKVSIIDLATQTMALTVLCGPEKRTQVTGICIYQ